MAGGRTRPLEGALIALTLVSVALGIGAPLGAPSGASAIGLPASPRPGQTPVALARAPVPGQATATPQPGSAPAPAAVGAPTALPTVDPKRAITAEKIEQNIKIEQGDAELIRQAPGTINILLMGIDITNDRRLARSDTVMVASINPEIPSVSILSIPRDLQVRIPGRGEDRINTVSEYGYLDNYPGGGPSFLAAVLRKNFGIRIDHYARIDLTGFMKVIDAIGGIDVLVECEVKDTFFNVKEPDGRIIDSVQPGLVRMSSAMANFYARSRYSTTDFDRARRQQRILKAIASKARRGDILNNVPALIATVQENFDTDLGLAELPFFIDLARRMDDIAIKQRVVTFPVVENYLRRDGAMVLRPTKDAIPFIVEALAPPPVAPKGQSSKRYTLEIINNSGRKDMELLAADRMNGEGFTVVAAKAGDKVQPRTQAIDIAEGDQKPALTFLAQFFGLATADVLQLPSRGAEADARLVLGQDYESCSNTSSAARERPTLPAKP